MCVAGQAECDALQPTRLDDASPFERTVGGWLFCTDFPRVWESEADGADVSKGRQGDGQGSIDFSLNAPRGRRPGVSAFRVW